MGLPHRVLLCATLAVAQNMGQWVGGEHCAAFAEATAALLLVPNVVAAGAARTGCTSLERWSAPHMVTHVELPSLRRPH